jgi:hypothetical protein
MRSILLILISVSIFTSCQNFIVNRRPDLTPGPVADPADPDISIPMPDEAVLMPPREERLEDLGLEDGGLVPPGVYRIRGTVLQIYPILEGDEGVCAQAPCLTAVRIDTVLGRGATTKPGILDEGQRVDVYFRYSTAATAGRFPDVEPALPGVKPGTPFSADISVAPESTDKRKVFELYKYKVNR